MAVYDGHAAQTGDRLSADELNELRASARRSQQATAVDGATITMLAEGSYVQLDESVRNPEKINDWFLGEIVDKPRTDPVMPDLEGSMYWVTEVQDASYITEPRRMRLENSQIARLRWLDQLPRVKTGDQTVSSYDANKDAFIPRLVVAANIAEMDARDSQNDVRSLAPGLVVKVFMLRSNDGTPRYYFSSPRTTIRQFIIIEGGQQGSIHDEYLDCHTWAGDLQTEGVETIRIARPWGLRSSPMPYSRDGKTYTRVDAQQRRASLNADPDKVETQVLAKRYFTRNVITASYGIAGGLGSAALTALGVEWLDDNRDGRAWAEKNVAS